MHQRLIVIGRVEVCDEGVIIGVKVVLETYQRENPQVPFSYIILSVLPPLPR